MAVAARAGCPRSDFNLTHCASHSTPRGADTSGEAGVDTYNGAAAGVRRGIRRLTATEAAAGALRDAASAAAGSSAPASSSSSGLGSRISTTLPLLSGAYGYGRRSGGGSAREPVGAGAYTANDAAGDSYAGAGDELDFSAGVPPELAQAAAQAAAAAAAAVSAGAGISSFSGAVGSSAAGHSGIGMQWGSSSGLAGMPGMLSYSGSEVLIMATGGASAPPSPGQAMGSSPAGSVGSREQDASAPSSRSSSPGPGQRGGRGRGRGRGGGRGRGAGRGRGRGGRGGGGARFTQFEGPVQKVSPDPGLIRAARRVRSH